MSLNTKTRPNIAKQGYLIYVYMLDSDDDGVVCERVRSRPPRPLSDTFLLGFLLGIPSIPAQSGQPISLIPAPGTLRKCHLYQARIKTGV